MHDHIATNKHHLTQKFHKNLKSFRKPQKFQENPKPRSKCVKCMKNEGLRDHTRGEIHRLGQNPRGEDGSRICRALNLDKYESVEVLSRIC